MRLSLDLGLGSVATLGAGVGGYVPPLPEYQVALRASQADFGTPLDQSGNYRDPQLNGALFPQTWQAGQPVAANAYRAPTVMNGRLYKATAGGGGNTGGSEPTWPTTIGGTVVSGAITFTCERGPWQTLNGYTQIASVRQAVLPSAGAYILPPVDWDMSLGQSLIFRLSQAWDYGVDVRLDNGALCFGNRPTTGTRRGFQGILDAGTTKAIRFGVSDGTATIGSGTVSSSFARRPGDGTLHTTLIAVDGSSKTMYAYSDAIPYASGDMASGSNPHNMTLAAVTGSTLAPENFYIGAGPGANSLDFGFTAIDLLVLDGGITEPQAQTIATWFQANTEALLPAGLLP